MKNLTRIFTPVDAAVNLVMTETKTGLLEFFAQRIQNEIGAFQIFVDQDPGAAAAGEVAVEGKLSAEGTYQKITSITFVDVGGTNPRTKIVTNVPVLPYMRIKMLATGGSFNPNAGTTVSAWFTE